MKFQDTSRAKTVFEIFLDHIGLKPHIKELNLHYTNDESAIFDIRLEHKFTMVEAISCSEPSVKFFRKLEDSILDSTLVHNYVGSLKKEIERLKKYEIHYLRHGKKEESK